MRKKKVGAIAIKSFALLVVLSTAYLVTANHSILTRWVAQQPTSFPPIVMNITGMQVN